MGTGMVASKDIPLKPNGTFRGHSYFDCDSSIYDNSRFGKNRYHRWDKYVGKDSWGEGLRSWAKANPKEPILLRNSTTGTFMYLRSSNQNF